MTHYRLGGLGSPTSIEIIRRSLAEAWILTDGPDALARAMVDAHGLAHDGRTSTLLELLAPVVALRVFGPAERMEERSRALEDTYETFRGSWEGLPEGFREELGGVAQAAHRLRRVADRLQEAERILEEAGWALDPRDGKVKRAEAGNRPYGWRRKLVVAVATDLGPDGELRNSAELRRQVSAVLATFLSAEEVDPRKGGPLDSDLGNELKKRAAAS